MALSGKTQMNDPVYNAAVNAQLMAAAIAQSVTHDKVLNFDLGRNGPDSIVVPRWDAMTVQTISDDESVSGADAVTTSGETISASRYRIFATLTKDLIDSSTGTLKDQFYVEAARQLASNIDAVMLASLAVNFSNVVGTSGNDLTSDQFLDGIYNLEANNAPDSVARESLIGTVPSGAQGYCAILHPQQINDLKKSIGASAGALSSNPSNFVYGRSEDEGGDVMMPGYAATIWDVPVFRSTHCPLSDANANRNGILISPAAVGFAYKFLAEIDEDKNLAESGTDVEVAQKFGFAELVDAYGVRIRSDA